MDPIISLIIPTRERCETLRYAIKSALAQESGALEIIVSDNASRDGTPGVVSEFKDPRLRSIRTDRRLSMCDHYEFAVERASGKFVLIIGDDDAVMPGAIRRLQECLETAADIYTWDTPVYSWPTRDSKAILNSFPKLSRDRWAAPAAKRSVRMGCCGYARSPSVYHSAVSRETLLELKKKTGRIFHSTQPDVFLSFALPALTERVFKIGRPLTMHGISEKSNGYDFRNERGEKNNIEKFLDEYGGYRLHPALYPGIPMRANMIPDAALAAMDLFPEYYRGVKFNYEAMWAHMLILWKFDAVLGVLGKAGDIRRRHEFNPAKFAFYYILLSAGYRLRKAFRRAHARKVIGARCPDNILDCAKMLAAR